MVWKASKIGMVKCNIDGASRGNPGRSSYGFCFRDQKGDIIYAEDGHIGFSTNIVAKATTIWRALQFGKLHQINNLLLNLIHLV